MPQALDEAYTFCQDLARRTGKNFYYSFLALPKQKRRAMCVVYAFMRVTDDLGDSGEPAEVRAQQLADWRGRWHGAIAAGTSDDPVLAAMTDVLRHYRIPAQYLDDVITGVEMDLQPAAVETFAQLEEYCYHVAGAVGLTCIHLWGFHDERAIAAAIDCGTAFQLTNILRDLREDAAMGRCYLPAEDLARFQLSRESIGQEQAFDDRHRDLMQFEIARAREYYARAQALEDYLEPPGRPILEIMLRIYGGLLDRIERNGPRAFTHRVELSRLHKLWIVGSTLMRHKWRAARVRNTYLRSGGRSGNTNLR